MSGLEETVLTLCWERGLTLAAAESCTGGLIAKRLTDIPGASQVFLGGVVSYTNHVKQQVLHVPENLLARCGAVSAEVARAMALGVRVLTGADLAVSRRRRPGKPGGHRVRGAFRAGGRDRAASDPGRRSGAHPDAVCPPRF